MFDLKPLSLSDLLEEELKQLPTGLVAIKYDRASLRALPRIMTVSFQFRQVLYDLLSNAIEALSTRADPRLEIKATCDQRQRKIELEISNNGPGIPDGVRERLFSPGVTTKPEKMGIGLWWSRSFMQATGGNLLLKQSELDSCTTFVVEIPCSDEDKVSAPPKPKPQGKPKDILVVDDDSVWREALVDNLAFDKYAIATASNYSEAVGLLTQSTFKVALLDLRLVDADPDNKGGLDLLAHIANSGLETKVIMISAYGTERDEQTAKQWPNFLAFYRKDDFDMKHVRNTVRTIVRTRAGKHGSLQRR